jgi:hypothetical protein
MPALAVDAIPTLPQPLLAHSKANNSRALTLSSKETQPPQLIEKIQQKGEGQMVATSGPNIGAD